MIILALDTALETCSAAVVDGGRVLAARSEPMARGHQERLAPLVNEVMREAGIGFDALDRIGVTVGPGSFTGLRVGLAFARGLGLALDAPVIGVGTLEAMGAGSEGAAVVVIDARREQVYVQAFRDGRPTGEPQAMTAEDASALAVQAGAATLIGSGGPLLSVPDAQLAPLAGADPAQVARLAATREPAEPKPIYLRAPDAKLPASALSA